MCKDYNVTKLQTTCKLSITLCLLPVTMINFHSQGAVYGAAFTFSARCLLGHIWATPEMNTKLHCTSFMYFLSYVSFACSQDPISLYCNSKVCFCWLIRVTLSKIVLHSGIRFMDCFAFILFIFAQVQDAAVPFNNRIIYNEICTGTMCVALRGKSTSIPMTKATLSKNNYSARLVSLLATKKKIHSVATSALAQEKKATTLCKKSSRKIPQQQLQPFHRIL